MKHNESIRQVQLYDDNLDFDANRDKGPFGDYADTGDTYENSGEPTYDFFGTPVYAPFGIAAGPLPTERHISAALAKGYDIVTLKSVRTSDWPCNPYPQVRPVRLHGDIDPAASEPIDVDDRYHNRLAVANSFGIPSLHPAQWQPAMRQAFDLPGKGQALLVAFQGTARGEGRDAFVQDHVDGVRLIRQTGADVVEINLSCPNEGEAVLACFDTDITERIVRAVRENNPDLKLLIKIAYFADKAQLERLVSTVGPMLDGISAINTIPAAVTDTSGENVFPGRAVAGISGAPIKWAGLEMTDALVSYRNRLSLNYKVIGIGGVLSADDFHEYRAAGADYVMSVSGAMWNPYLAQEIKQSLR